MPPEARPTNNPMDTDNSTSSSSSLEVNYPQVFTYLDETMRTVSFSHCPSDITPWLMYGPPGTATMVAEHVLSNLQTSSNNVREFLTDRQKDRQIYTSMATQNKRNGMRISTLNK